MKKNNNKRNTKRHSSTRMYSLIITFALSLTIVLTGASSAHTEEISQENLCTEEINYVTEYVSITDMVTQYIVNEQKYSSAPATEVKTVVKEITPEEKQKRYEAQKAYYQSMAERYRKELEEKEVEAKEEETIIASETSYEEDNEETYNEETSSNEYGTFVGNYKLTAYCPCSICCGEWAGGPCASGNYPSAGYTVACNSLPMGTVIYIEGYGTYVVEDTGGMGGSVIDIFFNTHEEALAFGASYANVYIVSPTY